MIEGQDIKTLVQIARSSSSERHRLRASEVLSRLRLDAAKHEDDMSCRKEERLRAIGWTPNGAAGTTNNVLVAMGDDALAALSRGVPLDALLHGTATGGGAPVRSDSPVLAPGDTTAGGRTPRLEGGEAGPGPVGDLRMEQPEVIDAEPEAGTRAHVEWQARQGGRNGHNVIDARPKCADCGVRLDEEPHDCLLRGWDLDTPRENATTPTLHPRQDPQHIPPTPPTHPTSGSRGS